MSLWNKIFTRNLAYKDIIDLEIPMTSAKRSYMKRIAIETSINFLARVFSQSKFHISGLEQSDIDSIDYKLNVRPSIDHSSTDFWHKVIYKLVYDNEVLIIQSDTDDLLIADDFERIRYAVYPDVFKDVIVEDYDFKRTFSIEEVIYLTYNNNNLEDYINGLFADYGEMFGRLIDSQMKRHQIRGIIKVDRQGGLDNQKMKKLQTFIDKTYKAFSENSVAIIPEVSGFQYEEINKTSNQGTDNGMENINRLRKMAIDEVAKLIGIPPSLVHGDVADIEQNMQAFKDFCLNPLIKKIEDELNSKLIKPKQYVGGARIEIHSLNKANPLERSEAVDKLVSSGSFTRNEVREMFGYPEKEGLDKFIITKNYETESTTEEG